jgi:hypothetical protein
MTVDPSAPRLVSVSVGWIHFKVTAGTVRIGLTAESVSHGRGIPFASADGLVSLFWRGELWVVADGTAATMEIAL